MSGRFGDREDKKDLSNITHLEQTSSYKQLRKNRCVSIHSTMDSTVLTGALFFTLD